MTPTSAHNPDVNTVFPTRTERHGAKTQISRKTKPVHVSMALYHFSFCQLPLLLKPFSLYSHSKQHY